MCSIELILNLFPKFQYTIAQFLGFDEHSTKEPKPDCNGNQVKRANELKRLLEPFIKENS